MMAQIFRYLLFPSTLAAAGASAWAGLRAGLQPAVILGFTSFGAIAVIAIGERLLPFDADWNRSRGDVVTDGLHSLFTSYACREAFKIALVAVLVPASAGLAAAFPTGLWPTAWPLVAQVGLAAAIAEFGQYVAHRTAHQWPWAWRLHATHHSPQRLYWLNAGRDHPLGVLWTLVPEACVLLLIRCPADVLTLFFVVESVHGLFQHGNVDVRLGILNWVFSGPELHRWHHSELTAEANHNYGATLIGWDIIFGSRLLPGPGAPQAIGLQDMPNFPQTFLKQMTVPFRWRTIAAP